MGVGRLVPSTTVIVIMAIGAGCNRGQPTREQPQPATVTNEPSAEPPFSFVALGSGCGLDFSHRSGRSAERLMPELTGSGAAFFDLDLDGYLDVLLLTQGPLLSSPTPMDPTCRVFANQDGRRFIDVTPNAGVGDQGSCHGVAIVDYDNDGFSDVFIARYGHNVFYGNQGDGTFRRRSGEGFAPGDGWYTGCTVIDGNRDGNLDLYVASYARLDVRRHPTCNRKAEQPPSYCLPHELEPGRHLYFENCGDGTFRDRTVEAGVDRRDGRGFQPMSAQLNDDDHPDLFVANDVSPKFLFLGRGDGTFDDVSEESGASRNINGQVEGSMGMAIEDVNNDGRPELFVTNYLGQLNTLFWNLGRGEFQDSTRRFELGGADVVLSTGWGTGFVDFDNDGWLDLFVSNGHVDDFVPGEAQSQYRQLAMIWRNDEGKKFTDCSRSSGTYFQTLVVGRTAAFGDFDQDGRVDILLNNLDDDAVLLRNQSPNGNWSLGLQCVGRLSNRDGVGTRLKVVTPTKTIHRQICGGESYLSCPAPVRTIGVGPAPAVAIVVRWPSGIEQELRPGPAETGNGGHRQQVTAVEPLDRQPKSR